MKKKCKNVRKKFTLNEVKYRVSNHSVESSNEAAYDEVAGVKRRSLYHEDGREEDTIYIFMQGKLVL